MANGAKCWMQSCHYTVKLRDSVFVTSYPTMYQTRMPGGRCSRYSRRGVERLRVCHHLEGSSRCDTEWARSKSLQEARVRCITPAAQPLRFWRRPRQNYGPNRAGMHAHYTMKANQYAKEISEK
ncbi:unnamed protein product, partial [Ectocarpus sp. 12 AP-2014]